MNISDVLRRELSALNCNGWLDIDLVTFVDLFDDVIRDMRAFMVDSFLRFEKSQHTLGQV